MSKRKFETIASTGYNHLNCKKRKIKDNNNNNKINILPSISCGEHHTIYITNLNNCYVYGSNYYGQLGLGDIDDHASATLLILPNNEKIVSISCSDSHTVCITDIDNCYVWGNNENGQLGLGDYDNRESPTLLMLPNNEKIVSISCGEGHTVCITDLNNCYVWGNSSNGQLGLGSNDDHHTPMLLTLPNNEKIVSISHGEDHTVCITDLNNCYVWGYNYDGQLGLGDNDDRHTPTLLVLSSNEKIVSISCGGDYTISLTDLKNCYAWGFNIHGQLGLGDNDNHNSPTLLVLPNNEKIVSTSCGRYHATCITQLFNCYVWGYNKYGQLGLGDNDDRNKPTSLTLPNNENIVSISCGREHMVCMTDLNNCYAWGGNNIRCNKPTVLLLPDDTWNQTKHKYGSERTKKMVEMLLMMGLKNKDGERLRPESLVSLLPKDVTLYICSFLPMYWL